MYLLINFIIIQKVKHSKNNNTILINNYNKNSKKLLSKIKLRKINALPNQI